MGENITSEPEHELPDTPKEELSEFLKFDIDQKEQAYNTRNHIQAEGSLGVRGCWPSASRVVELNTVLTVDLILEYQFYRSYFRTQRRGYHPSFYDRRCSRRPSS